jgi:uncharacterized protein (DUF2267 family)
MDYQGFITTVQEGAHISGEEAQRAACVTLKTLSERLSGGETRDVAEHLPRELHSCVEMQADAEPFDVNEFLRRIGEREGVDRSRAERDARAVFTALWQTVGPEELADVRSELPKDFYPLLDEPLPTAPGGPAPRPLPFNELVARIANRSQLSREQAQRATEAVLEVLASRISGGQVDDLARVLPAELHPALEQGKRLSGGVARPLSLDEFLRGVASLEGGGIGIVEAREHARAVFATLREAIPEKEFSDTTDQLPKEYAAILAPA